jgi:hypothetical protein
MCGHEIYQRDDGLYDVVNGDATAGPFPTIAFAMQVAADEKPDPVPVAKFRHFKVIREVRRDARP